METWLSSTKFSAVTPGSLLSECGSHIHWTLESRCLVVPGVNYIMQVVDEVTQDFVGAELEIKEAKDVVKMDLG